MTYLDILEHLTPVSSPQTSPKLIPVETKLVPTKPTPETKLIPAETKLAPTKPTPETKPKPTDVKPSPLKKSETQGKCNTFTTKNNCLSTANCFWNNSKCMSCEDVVDKNKCVSNVCVWSPNPSSSNGGSCNSCSSITSSQVCTSNKMCDWNPSSKTCKNMCDTLISSDSKNQANNRLSCEKNPQCMFFGDVCKPFNCSLLTSSDCTSSSKCVSCANTCFTKNSKNDSFCQWVENKIRYDQMSK